MKLYFAGPLFTTPERTWNVGVRIEGSGFENVGAVWVTDDPSGGGQMAAVSGRARQLTGSPDRGDTLAHRALAE